MPQSPTNDEAWRFCSKGTTALAEPLTGVWLTKGSGRIGDFKLGLDGPFLAVSRGRPHLISTGDLLGECLEEPGEILLNGSDEQKQAMSG